MCIHSLHRNFSYDDVHVKVARSIARLARECGVQRLIHFSALNASPNPPAIIVRKPSRFLQSKVGFRIEKKNENISQRILVIFSMLVN